MTVIGVFHLRIFGTEMYRNNIATFSLLRSRGQRIEGKLLQLSDVLTYLHYLFMRFQSSR